MREYYTLTAEDVGKPWLKAFGRTWLTCDFIGKVQMRDIGKRVYLVDGVLQVESDRQLGDRLLKEGL